MHCKINDEAHNKNRQKIVYAIRSTKWQKENKQHGPETWPITKHEIRYDMIRKAKGKRLKRKTERGEGNPINCSNKADNAKYIIS